MPINMIVNLYNALSDTQKQRVIEMYNKGADTLIKSDSTLERAIGQALKQGGTKATELKKYFNNLSTKNSSNAVFKNGYQSKYVADERGVALALSDYGIDIKNTSLKGSVNSAGKSMDNQGVWKDKNNNLYVWVGDGGTNGYYAQIGTNGVVSANLQSVDFSKIDNSMDPDAYRLTAKVPGLNSYVQDKYSGSFALPLDNLTKQAGSKNTVSNNKAPSYSAPKAYDITKDPNYKNAMDRIDELEKMYAEATRVWNADEVAKHLGVEDQYNKDNILKMFNEQTNEYYDDAVAEQQALRNDYVKNNANYINQLVDSYVDSTKYAAPTATNRGIQAANLMATNMNADATNAMNDYGMYQNILNQEKSREAELKQNDWLATEKYNNFGTVLSNWSANKNTSDVQQYIDSLKSATNYYAADRAYQAYLSQANAQKYAGLAGASQNYAYNAAQAANSQASSFANLWNYYYNTHGKNAAVADSMVANVVPGRTN